MRIKKVGNRSGFSLIEVVLSASVLALLARVLVETSAGMRRITTTGNVQVLLQQEAEKATRAIVYDLRRSGFALANDKTYPYVFEGGVAAEPFDMHSHEVPTPEVENPSEGDYGTELVTENDAADFTGNHVPDWEGPNREMVFCMPNDANGDERPDFHPVDGVLWSLSDFSYVVTLGGDGVSRLERRTNGAQPQTIASGVERIVFDTPESSGWNVPLGSVRARVYLRRSDPNGMVFRQECEITVKLRNGAMIL